MYHYHAMQIRFPTKQTAEQYVASEGWKQARFERCPLHPLGGCGFAHHGHYARKDPPGTLISRAYCPEASLTFSLLPDCFASHFPGSLDAIEEVVIAVEKPASVGAIPQLATELRSDIEEPGALRWLRRRKKYVAAILTTLAGILATVCLPTLTHWRQHLGVDRVLVTLRERVAKLLPKLPCFFGFNPQTRAPT